MNRPNRHRQERDFLLWLAKTAPARKQRSQPLPIHPSNYAAVYTPPTNNSAPMYGPCLIWRHGLSNDGYGVTSQDGRQVLAHRVAYEVSRGSIPPNTPILHMCNRRSCIQPAHLYAGTPQENAEDRKAKTEHLFTTMSMLEKRNRQVKECAPRVWPELPHTQLSFRDQPEHECRFTIPIESNRPKWLLRSHPHEGFVCETCFQPPPETSMWWFLRELNGGIDRQEEERRNRQRYLELNRNNPF